MLDGRPSVVQRSAATGRRNLAARLSGSDRAFRAILRGGGGVVLMLLVLVGAFLFFRAYQALHKAGLSFLTTQDWNPDAGRFGIAAVIVGTVLIALVAIVVAMPLALGMALYISEYAPRRLQRLLIAIVPGHEQRGDVFWPLRRHFARHPTTRMFGRDDPFCPVFPELQVGGKETT